MPPTAETTAFERGVRPVLRIVLPEKAKAILHYRVSPALKLRIEELALKSTEGLLTTAEQKEYAGYVKANKFVAILKRHARELISAER